VAGQSQGLADCKKDRAMKQESTNILADAIKEYYGDYELEELCNQYNIEVDYLGVSPNHKKIANKLITKGSQNYRRCLDKILPELLDRCNHRILNSTWESNVFDEQMVGHLKKLKYLLSRENKTSGAEESANFVFKAKADAIKFFARAKTAVTLVDTHIGTATLESLKQVQHPIRILTRKDEDTFPSGFGDILKKFSSGGHDVEIRRHVVLNDRYFFLNGRCWLVSNSLNEIGSKLLSTIECVDAKSAIAKAIEQKWREAEIFPI
jgi:hypothetical protein